MRHIIIFLLSIVVASISSITECYGVDSLYLLQYRLNKIEANNLHNELNLLIGTKGDDPKCDTVLYAKRYESKQALFDIKKQRRHLKGGNEILLGDMYLNKIHGELLPMTKIDSLKTSKIDSLKQLLALDCYVRAYYNSDTPQDTIAAIQHVANVFHKQEKYDLSLYLHDYALSMADCVDSLRFVSLEGKIESIYKNDGIRRDTIRQRLLQIYPLLKEQETLYVQGVQCQRSDVLSLYADLAYIAYTLDDNNSYNYSLKYFNAFENIEQTDEYADINVLLKNFLRYDASPDWIIGEWLYENHKYAEAIEHYKTSANLIDRALVQNVTPLDIYQLNIWGQEYFASWPAVYLYKNKIAKCLYKLGDIKSCDNYLLSSFMNCYDNVLYSAVSFKDLLNGFNDIKDTSVVKDLCNHTNSQWGYNVALLLKGHTIILQNILQHTIDYEYKDYIVNRHIKDFYIYDNPEFYFLKEHSYVDLYKQRYNHTYFDVFGSIAANHRVAIEFVCFFSYENDKEMYYAFCLTPNSSMPYKIKICAQDEMEDLFAQNFQLNKNITPELYNLIWSKLEPYINEGDDVYFAPDGLLYQMNIEVLQDADGRRANEKWNLHRVSSTRELCMDKPDIPVTSAVLYGGLTYFMDEESMARESAKYHPEPEYKATRGVVDDPILRKGWNELKYAKEEVLAVSDILHRHNVSSKVYVEECGNEESFKALSGKQTPVIHLATHGFFYSNDEAERQDWIQQFQHVDQPSPKPDNSLRRSGLILSGAVLASTNHTLPNNVEDGILLAEEIASMDLTGTDLVVLSACDTGLGEITSEGVFGLQRALKNAGVQTIIMSLWKVDDAATSLFMQTFYECWLGGNTKHEAFAEAQRTVRNHVDYSDPSYWAGFIMLD